MSEHPFDELERLGETPVPPVDASFADRLESDLRVRHGGRRRAPAWAPGWRRAALGLAAVVFAVVGVIGLGQLRIGDDDVPVEITGPEHDGSEVAAEPPDVGDGGDAIADGESRGGDAETEGAAGSTAASTPTPTPTPAGDEATSGGGGPVAVVSATPAPATTPTSVQTPTPGSGSTEAPSASPTPAPTAPPRPTAGPSPTSIRPEPAPTSARPPATVLPLVTPEPTATGTPTPRPSATPAPVALDAVCAVRNDRDAMGVICEWQTPVKVDIGRFTVHRTRNGGPRELVANVAAPRTQSVDRDVQPGDSVVYVVTGLVGDAVRAVSERLTVRIPPG